MAGQNEDPNLKFLTDLGEKMHVNSEVRRIVMYAMSVACKIVVSDKTDQQKAMSLGQTVEDTSRQILDLI